MRMISHERFKELAYRADEGTRNGGRVHLNKGVYDAEHERLCSVGRDSDPEPKFIFLKSQNPTVRAEGNKVFLIDTNGIEHCFTFSKTINFEEDDRAFFA